MSTSYIFVTLNKNYFISLLKNAYSLTTIMVIMWYPENKVLDKFVSDYKTKINFNN